MHNSTNSRELTTGTYVVLKNTGEVGVLLDLNGTVHTLSGDKSMDITNCIELVNPHALAYMIDKKRGVI